MSCYDQPFFKTSNNDKKQNITTTTTNSQQDSEFKKSFIKTYKNTPKQELKSQINIATNDDYFDYVYKQNIITEDFLEESNLFSDKRKEEEKINFLLQFLKEKYLLITPKILKQIFSDIGISKNFSTIDEYTEMIQFISKKSTINLLNMRDLVRFKNVLLGRDVDYEENLPDVNKNEIVLKNSSNKDEKVQAFA